ncbi:MAG: hypothetical protein ACTHMS_07580 [Jatrophihabitans sp.]|uniref:hypothetical protein n=1 Tax=Jatrophihabitans sp. TaxID=1932789 RepID=UPI003F7D44AE
MIITVVRAPRAVPFASCNTLAVGRHSAPEDDDPDEPGEPVATVEHAPRGRHALVVDEVGDVVATAGPEVTAEAPVAAPIAEDESETRPATTRPPRGTRADLRLVREHPDVRNRVLAALLLPFVLFVVVLAVIGRLGDGVVLLWAPVLLAGVLVGVALDLGHRAHRADVAVSEPEGERAGV